MSQRDDDTQVTITGPDGREVRLGSNLDEALRRLDAVAKGSIGERRARSKALLEGTTMPDGFLLSDEVRDIAQRVIDSDPRFDVTTGIAIGYALQWDQDPAAKGGLHAIAKCVKAPPLWRDLGQHEVIIFAVQRAWQHLGQKQREALVAHELSHIGGRNDSGSVVLLDHDIEEFAWVVKRYGQWHPALENFAEQLGLGLDAAKAPAP